MDKGFGGFSYIERIYNSEDKTERHSSKPNIIFVQNIFGPRQKQPIEHSSAVPTAVLMGMQRLANRQVRAWLYGLSFG